MIFLVVFIFESYSLTHQEFLRNFPWLSLKSQTLDALFSMYSWEPSKCAIKVYHYMCLEKKYKLEYSQNKYD